ncbi:MAG: Fe-S-containing hydro-lyase [Chloroflexi bacterium]|nr:Fe-S-containing hydro-lyase [Chloroflexota bacterium]
MDVVTPLNEDVVQQLRAGDRVTISGVVYVARDAAHKLMVEALARGEALPFDPRGQIIYYMGPSPARPGRPIGAAGPTTSGRMDAYTLPLLQAGLKGMIGKGDRSAEVRQALVQYQAVYLTVTGGAAALVARAIRKAEVVAYDHLGAEALRRLEVENLPAIVVNDAFGGDAYEEGRARYRRPIA